MSCHSHSRSYCGVRQDDLFRQVVSGHLTSVFRQRPSDYLIYLSKLIGVREDATFLDYYEIAATRDLVVHNNRVVNGLYLDKARDKARGVLDDKVAVNEDYYYEAIAIMKKVSEAIERDVETKYGIPQGEP